VRQALGEGGLATSGDAHHDHEIWHETGRRIAHDVAPGRLPHRDLEPKK
jgi:hypothetical protein